MIPSLEDAIFNLKEGEVSDSIETDDGIFILKVNKKYPAQTEALAEVKNKIYNLDGTEKVMSPYDYAQASKVAQSFVGPLCFASRMLPALAPLHRIDVHGDPPPRGLLEGKPR